MLRAAGRRMLTSDVCVWFEPGTAVQVSEGGTLTIHASASGGRGVYFNYSITDGSAERGDDYEAYEYSWLDPADGEVFATIAEDGFDIVITGLTDEEIEQIEDLTLTIEPGDYDVGYPPEWGPHPSGQEVTGSVTIDLHQGAVGMGDPTGAILPPGSSWDYQTKTLTLERPEDATTLEATIHAWVSSGGKVQKNAPLASDWINLPQGVTQPSSEQGPRGQDGKIPFKFGVFDGSDLGSYTFRIEYTAAIFVDITVVVVDNV
jgi:hypothetical protein